MAGDQTGPRPPTGRLGETVYVQLKERLMAGAYLAGDALSVEDLRAEFSVSKQPIMLALHQLAADGLVEILPQVGCRVRAYSGRDVEDFFHMFGGFEGTIAATAAVRRTDEQLARLAKVAAETDRLRVERIPAVRTAGYRRLNREFHGLIHEMAHSPIMTATSRRMWDLSDFLISTTGGAEALHDALDGRHADHEEIRAALTAGDAAQARQATEAHIVGTLAVIGYDIDLRQSAG